MSNEITNGILKEILSVLKAIDTKLGSQAHETPQVMPEVQTGLRIYLTTRKVKGEPDAEECDRWYGSLVTNRVGIMNTNINITTGRTGKALDLALVSALQQCLINAEASAGIQIITEGYWDGYVSNLNLPAETGSLQHRVQQMLASANVQQVKTESDDPRDTTYISHLVSEIYRCEQALDDQDKEEEEPCSQSPESES